MEKELLSKLKEMQNRKIYKFILYGVNIVCILNFILSIVYLLDNNVGLFINKLLITTLFLSLSLEYKSNYESREVKICLCERIIEQQIIIDSHEQTIEGFKNIVSNGEVLL